MWNDLWAGFRGERIGRAPFFFYILFLYGSFLIFALVVGVGAWLAGDASQGVQVTGGLAVLLLMAVWGVFVAVAGISLAAARGRDIGWDPWIAAILFILANGLMWIVLSIIAPKEERTDI